MIKKVLAEIYRPKKKFVQPSKEFVFSEKYNEMMSMHLPIPDSFDLHEAQNKTQNFLFRHHVENHVLCMFRWRGIQKHKEKIVELASQKNTTNIDFGGAACPLGFNTKVVDFLKKDAFGRSVPFKFLSEVPGDIDFLFTSHTLEHVQNLEEVLGQIKNKLSENGTCIFHVPSFYCERWRVGTHQNRKYNDHCWTFGLSTDKMDSDDFQNFLAIDTMISKFFQIEICEYCGDDSIYIMARKKD